MKANIKQLVEQVIDDNRQLIIDFGGNPYQYLHSDFANQDQGQYWYLTDDEIEDWYLKQGKHVTLFCSTNHDENGWSGMSSVREAIQALCAAAGFEIIQSDKVPK